MFDIVRVPIYGIAIVGILLLVCMTTGTFSMFYTTVVWESIK